MKTRFTFSFILFFAVLVLSMVSTVSVFADDKVSTGTGNWSDAATWNPAGVPAAGDNVFIENGHTITVNGNYACANFNISTTGVIAVGANILTVNGKIRAYTEAAPGTNSTSPGANCITTTTGKVVFTNAGAITVSGEWGANTQSWRAEFDISGGGTATLATAFKAGEITIKNGIIETNNDIRPDNNGVSPDGTLTIDAGATLKFTSSTAANCDIQKSGSNANCAAVTINGILEYSQNVGQINSNSITTNAATIKYSRIGVQTLCIHITSCKFLVLDVSGAKTINTNLSITDDGSVTLNGTASAVAGTGSITSYGSNTSLISNSSAGFTDLDAVWPTSNGPTNVIINSNVSRVSSGTRTLNGTLTLNGAAGVDDGLTVRNSGTKLIFGNGATIIRNEGELKLVSSGLVEHGTASGHKVNLTIGYTTDAGAEFPAQGSITPGGIGTVTINNGAVYNLPNANRTLTDLVFSSGKVIQNNNALTVTGNITGHSSSNYVVTAGTNQPTGLKRNVSASDVVFPIGPSTSLYHPATITNTGTADDFTVKVSSPLASCITTDAMNATWDITEGTPGGSYCTLSLDFTGAGTTGSFNSATAKIAHCNGTTIDYSNGSVTGNVATGSGFTSFSPFGVTSNITLPVEFLDFSARQVEKTVILEWQTASEINSDKFVIESSRDGKTFSAIGTVMASGIRSSVNDYAFTDLNPERGVNYYRLRQYDLDGSFDLSRIVSVLYITGKTEKFEIIPSIVYQGQTVRIYLDSDTVAGEASEIGVFNQNGSLIKKLRFSNNYAELEATSEFSSGIYFVKAISPGNVHVAKFQLIK